MSKLLFWSPLHGQGQTSNLHVTGFIMSLLYGKKVLIMQTHFAKNNLEGPLVGTNVDRKKTDGEELFQDIGLDAAVTYSSMNKLDKKALEACCLSFSRVPILLLPGTEIKNKETFDRDIGKSVLKMIRDANTCVDLVLIDSNSGDDELSVRLMDMADLIIINLTQRRYVLDQFFAVYGEQFIDNPKVFYLFGDYDDNSSYNINNFRRKYKKYMNGNNSGVIPYCTKYMDAQNESNIIVFMKEGLHIQGDNDIEKLFHQMKKALQPGKYERAETDYFFHRSCLAIEKMFDQINIPVKKEYRKGKRYE